MNTLDAIIATTILISIIGLFLTTIIQTNYTILDANTIIQAKTKTIICATLIDSIFANSAKYYNQTINCNPDKNKLILKIGNMEKSSFSITTIEKKQTIEVKTNDHYPN